MTDQTRPCTIGGCNAPRIDDVCFAHGLRRLIRELRWSLRHAMGREPEMPQFPAVAVPHRRAGNPEPEWHMDCPTCLANTAHATRAEARAAAKTHACRTIEAPARGSRWQEWELDIVRDARSFGAATRRLPHRPAESTRKHWTRLHRGRVGTRLKWTPEMDAVALDNSQSTYKAAASIGLSQSALIGRRQRLLARQQRESAA